MKRLVNTLSFMKLFDDRKRALEQLNKLVAVLSSRWREMYQNAFPTCRTIIVAPLSTNNTRRGCYFRSLSCIWNKIIPTSFFPRGSNSVRNNDGWTARAICFMSLSETPPTFEKKKSKSIFLWRTNKRWLTTLPKSVILQDQPKV